MDGYVVFHVGGEGYSRGPMGLVSRDVQFSMESYVDPGYVYNHQECTCGCADGYCDCDAVLCESEYGGNVVSVHS